MNDPTDVVGGSLDVLSVEWRKSRNEFIIDSLPKGLIGEILTLE